MHIGAKVLAQEKPDSQRMATLITRLPVTFRPFVNQELRDWERLFAYERKTVQSLLSFLLGLTPEEFDRLFAKLRTVEAKMNVAQWSFSEQNSTIENASMLARSPHYQEWREAVDMVFQQSAEWSASSAASSASQGRNRLILIILPANLPVSRTAVWQSWSGKGKELALSTEGLDAQQFYSDALLAPSGSYSTNPSSFVTLASERAGHLPEDLWMLDADSGLKQWIPKTGGSAGGQACIYLGYPELRAFRDLFLDRQNWVRDNLKDADSVMASLREVDVGPMCPANLKVQISAREFVRDVFISGNGSTVYGNSFVEWAASEGIRRARPSTLVARFGTRNKPKPFASLAVLENQRKFTAIPDIEDPEGSAVDAEMLASYIWLAASRFDEYKNALCLCIADAIPAAYIVAPSDHPLLREAHPLAVSKLLAMLKTWLS